MSNGPTFNSFPEEVLCKLAGYGAVLYSAYTATMLESVTPRPSTIKLSNLNSKEPSPSNRVKNANFLNYLEHRTLDLFKNYSSLTKLSYEAKANDILLFEASPERYYYTLGKEILSN